MERRWVGLREAKRRERYEERKMIGRREERKEQGQTGSLEGGGEDESKGSWCWEGRGV